MVDSVAANNSVPPTASSPNPAPNLAENMAKLASLAALVADDSGKTSSDAKYDAYSQVRRMVVAGTFYSSGAEGRVLFDKIYQSEFGKKVYDLQIEYTNAVAAKRNTDTHDMGLVMVDLFDSYSAEEQKILFDSVISPVLSDGVRRYSDVQSWKSNVEAQYKLMDFMNESKNDPSLKSDPKFAEAETLWLMADTTSESWTSLVLKLFGATPSSKLDLSEEARKVVGDVKPGVQAGPYEAGSIASMRV